VAFPEGNNYSSFITTICYYSLRLFCRVCPDVINWRALHSPSITDFFQSFLRLMYICRSRWRCSNRETPNLDRESPWKWKATPTNPNHLDTFSLLFLRIQEVVLRAHTVLFYQPWK